ncbi:hypothetical protein EVAR_23221_1 [Eumeta japonica]|uniref:Uncharacterized protein n=1 Tax=Eumeta variegata TaxID=151549 RepID=A0A4C1VE85_EUMVA|nr:hypothetical protein EVAR_23221_1 [Eumeta japonica]
MPSSTYLNEWVRTAHHYTAVPLFRYQGIPDRCPTSLNACPVVDQAPSSTLLPLSAVCLMLANVGHGGLGGRRAAANKQFLPAELVHGEDPLIRDVETDQRVVPMRN